ncbi:hypothetical protein BSLG_003542 [Batrachochytrium salamandrivorans]|nr:hypothetical protein BSLG_003542 [Batrachochytrium salamandrivorans]
MDTQAPRIEDTPGMATDILSDPAAFDMAWAVFDNGVAQLFGAVRSPIEFQADGVRRHFNYLAIRKATRLFINITSYGVRLTFVLSSADTDAIASLFGDNFTKAYTVFRYILLWMNWKIYDPSHYDERYYEAYFNDFSKEERKRVMSSIGSDILQYIETHPDKVLETVATSFKEIVPLLEGDHLVIFWKFFQKLQSNENSPIDDNYTLDNFYSKLSSKQIRRCLLYQHPISPNSPLTSQTDTGTPATFSLVTDLDGWEMLCTSIYVYIAKRYESSSDAGDQAIDGARDLISISFSTDSDPFHQEISLTDKIIHFAPNPTTCISSILNSSIVESKEQRILILRSYVLHCALFGFLRSKGCRILAQLDQLQETMTQQDENSILALHMNTSVYPQLRILESLAQWIRELGATHPFTPPLENLLKEANAHQYSYSSIPSPPILPSSSLTNAHMSSTHHPVSKLKKSVQDCPSAEEVIFQCALALEEVEIHRGDSQSIYAGQNARMVFDLLEMWFEMHPAVVSQKVCQAQLLYPKPLQLIVENIATLFYPDKLYIETHIHAILCRVECDLQTNPIPHIQFLTSLFGNDATLPRKTGYIHPVAPSLIYGAVFQVWELLCGTLLDCLWICLAGMETPRESCEPISYSSEEEKSRSIVGGIPLYHLPEIYREVCDFEADLCMLLEWIKTLIVRFPESILLIVDAWRCRLFPVDMHSSFSHLRDVSFGFLDLISSQKLCQTSKILDKVDAVVAGLLQCLTSLHSSDFLFSDLDINCGFGCVLSSHEFLLSLNRILAKMESELEVRENVMVLPEDSVTSFWVELDLPKVLGFTIGLFYAALCCASELTDVEKVVMFKRYISDPILPDVGNVVFHALGTLSYHSLGIRALLSTPTAVLVLSILQTKTQAAANIQRNALLLLQNMYEHARSDLPKGKLAKFLQCVLQLIFDHLLLYISHNFPDTVDTDPHPNLPIKSTQ